MEEKFPDLMTSESFEEHIELESRTGRFRREQVETALIEAEVEAMANKRRHMRITPKVFKVQYNREKSSVFSLGKQRCHLIDASINGLGIGSNKILEQGEKLKLVITCDDKSTVEKFTITAVIVYVGRLSDANDKEKYKFRYGLRFTQKPPKDFADYLTRETLKLKVQKAVEQKESSAQSLSKREVELEEL